MRVCLCVYGGWGARWSTGQEAEQQAAAGSGEARLRLLEGDARVALSVFAQGGDGLRVAGRSVVRSGWRGGGVNLSPGTGGTAAAEERLEEFSALDQLGDDKYLSTLHEVLLEEARGSLRVADTAERQEHRGRNGGEELPSRSETQVSRPMELPPVRRLKRECAAP